MPKLELTWPGELPPVLLVGAGVVGQAIAEAHLERAVPFVLGDQSALAVRAAAERWSGQGIPVAGVSLPIQGMSAVVVGNRATETEAANQKQPIDPIPIVIESIVEQVQAKRDLFVALQQAFGTAPVLCSNTSTLKIEQIADAGLAAAGRVCGMHFFMPVHARAAVEVVATSRSDQDAIDRVVDHAGRIGKRPIRCQDGPGFIVNRMLSPYLNQALLLLCRGATESQIQRAALAYGMPMSPLELIDWIGAPTMFHAGRAFVNAFPTRIDASPVVPALVKRKRMGRAVGAGLYDYTDGVRSSELAPESKELIEMYRTSRQAFTDGDVLRLLAIPMWIEAGSLLAEGVAESMNTVDQAMAGGLGFTAHSNWSEFFNELGQTQIDSAMNRWGQSFRSMNA
ncbi:3-hydroxyacyl-CoA dehydrogenase family protein [Stieleria sp. TO1_6]|uniref:3-hydroxyacyl-CoA dehydrogenase family protein n=1 Tax=Stieleria tagensis TaxID=2956795 RepID=UPI00209AE0E5|nr:3-hydroxyacyl-CoA dehydrogenase family protein [Stieleria tagensis]MCO8121120.1 3-hydroxyacyl-CoA dehydrogenase family protein [Stieleria tagensis]